MSLRERIRLKRHDSSSGRRDASRRTNIDSLSSRGARASKVETQNGVFRRHSHPSPLSGRRALDRTETARVLGHRALDYTTYFFAAPVLCRGFLAPPPPPAPLLCRASLPPELCRDSVCLLCSVGGPLILGSLLPPPAPTPPPPPPSDCRPTTVVFALDSGTLPPPTPPPPPPPSDCRPTTVVFALDSGTLPPPTPPPPPIARCSAAWSIIPVLDRATRGGARGGTSSFTAASSSLGGASLPPPPRSLRPGSVTQRRRGVAVRRERKGGVKVSTSRGLATRRQGNRGRERASFARGGRGWEGRRSSMSIRSPRLT